MSRRKNRVKIKAPNSIQKKVAYPSHQPTKSLSLPFGHAGPCKQLSVCGACPLLPLSYEAQLKWKESDLYSHLNHYKSLKHLHINPSAIVGPQQHYRHTAKPSVRSGTSTHTSLKIGLYQPRSHSLIDLDQCFVQTPQINHLINDIKKLAPQFGLLGYEHGDEDKNDQVSRLRYVVIRQGEHAEFTKLTDIDSHQGLDTTSPALHLTLILTHVDHPSILKLIQQLSEHHSNLIGVAIHLNRLKGNAIFDFSVPTEHLWGEPSLSSLVRLDDHSAPITLKISATSFAQVNPYVAEKAYQHVVTLLNPQPNELAVDLYCGVGAIGFLMAQKARQNGGPLQRLWGLEETPSSIFDAQYNAQLNQIDEAEFIEGKVEDHLDQLLDQVLCYDQSSLVLALNPSRRGCHPEVLKRIVQLQPRTIAYMSCHARTLSRDLDRLNHLGYSADHTTLFDMFPGSYHYETVTSISKR